MRREGIEKRADPLPCGLDGSFCSLSQQVLKLGEDLFDWIKVRAVGWEKQEPRALSPYRGPDGRLFMAGEVIQDDNVAGSKSRAELFFDPCGEAGGIDRLIEDEGCINPITAQCGDEGHRLPVAIRHLGVKPLTNG